MGVTIRQKNGDAAWWVFISHNGNRASKKVGSKGAAQKVKEDIEARLKLGQYNFNGGRFKDYAKTWIEITVPANCKESTVDAYRKNLEQHILPVFGDLEVTAITRENIKDFLYTQLNEGKARRTVNLLRAIISGVLNKTVDAEIVSVKRAQRLGRIGKKEDGNEQVKPDMYLTAEETKKLLDTVKKDRLLSSYYSLFLLLFRTGARIGEAISLQWGDIDFNDSTIHIQRTYYKGRLGTPKNGKSRTVIMSPQLKAALKDLKQNRRTDLIEDSAWVFINGTNKLIDTSNWRRRFFNVALKKAGIKRIKIHSCRHTYASLRLNKGDSVHHVADQLGDRVDVVWKVYSHCMPEGKREEVDALDDLHLDAPYTHLEEIAKVGNLTG